MQQFILLFDLFLTEAVPYEQYASALQLDVEAFVLQQLIFVLFNPKLGHNEARVEVRH